MKSLHLSVSSPGLIVSRKKDGEVGAETSDRPAGVEAGISYALCCRAKKKRKERKTPSLRSVVVLTFLCLLSHSFFFLSPFPSLEEINPSPLPFLPPSFFFPCWGRPASPGHSSLFCFKRARLVQPEQFALQSHASGDACLSCFITGGAA